MKEIIELNSFDMPYKRGFWKICISNCLLGILKNEKPIRLRKKLAQSFHQQLSKATNPYSRFLVLIFGSVARLESANDIDFLIIFEEVPDEHVYQRFSVGEWNIDLNLANPSWLRNAWKDVEWGYWINDAHVIESTDHSLEMIWRNAANKYWSKIGRINRSSDHISMAKNIVCAASSALTKNTKLLYRYYIHEATRAIVCSILDRVGDKIYSHRTFIYELTIKGSELLSNFQVTVLIYALTGKKDSSSDQYILIRRYLSELLRNDKTQSLVKISPNLSRKQRIEALTKLVESNGSYAMENILREEKAEEWLPADIDAMDIDLLNQIILEIEKHSFQTKYDKKFPAKYHISAPYKSNISGVRWIEFKENRLKLIVNTGGCRTPSCTFCPLPHYSQKSEIHYIPQILDVALSKYKPRSLALYTDGNFLDIHEISSKDRQSISRIVKQYNVKELTIESIPRFVSHENLAKIIDLSKTKLTLAMGFQSYGNSFAVSEMGRPDVDVLFDRAIDIAHYANASVRLYLMADFERSIYSFTNDQLVKSIQWANARAVETLSICLYRSPLKVLDIEKESLYRNTLVKFISSIGPLQGTKIEILNSNLDSCVSN